MKFQTIKNRQHDITMVRKTTALLYIVFSTLLADCRAEGANASKPPAPLSAAQNLKSFALSSCLAAGLEAKEAQKDAEDATGGFLELGSLGIDAYQEVAQAGRVYLDKQYLSYGGGKLVTMRCINFFYSKELDLIVKKHLLGNKRQ